MGRVRQFDMDAVLDAATGMFWSKGFTATSVDDLLVEMGIQKGSLYKAFGNKRSLFLEVLDRYHRNVRQRLTILLASEGSSLEGLRCWFNEVLKHCRGKSGSKGCLTVNTIVELAPHDATIKKKMQIHLKRLEQIFIDTIDAGKTSGEFRAGLDSRVAAKFLMNATNGLYVASKTARTGKEADQLVDFMLACLR